LSATVGVEEEFLVVGPGRGVPVPLGADIARQIPQGDLAIQLELSPAQIETATGVCADLMELREQLRRGRRRLADAAQVAGGRLAATGTPPVGEPPQTTTQKPRYREMARRYGALATGIGLCGCHVHVGVASTEIGLQVSNFLRPWLPTLLVVTANSPFHRGRDTRFASWRFLQWSRWALAGPPPYFDSLDEYRALVDAMLDSQVIMDEAMIYWYVRPSVHVPTVEVRIGDVAASVDDAVLLAALARALVESALESLERGRTAPRVPDALLRAACWQAARGGLTGPGVELVHGGPTTGEAMLDTLVEHVRPVLARDGDEALVEALVKRLRAHGTGAARQRRDFERRREIADVVDGIVARTLE
jgi:glutamate---cysteine ligase / carboxylate-amine ligase